MRSDARLAAADRHVFGMFWPFFAGPIVLIVDALCTRCPRSPAAAPDARDVA